MEATRIESAVQVTNLQGRAFIIDANGITKAVTAGQVLAPGMVLLTDTNTQITYADAPTAPKVAVTSINEASDTAPVTASDIAAIQAAILAGEDPSELFEAPAAGNAPPTGVFNGSSGNAGFVVIDRVGDSRLAEAGYDTAFANALGPFVFEESGDLLADDSLVGDSNVNDDAPPLNTNSIPELVIGINPPLTPSNSIPQAGNNMAFVEERALASGSNPLSNNETATGRFTINTGQDALAKLELQQADGSWVEVTQGGQVIGLYGNVTVTVVDGEYQWRYDLKDAVDHPDMEATGIDDVLQESFVVRVTDSDGDQASGQLNISILDDGPIAELDTNGVGEGGSVSGDVLLNDVFGADGAAAGGGVVGVKVGTDATAPATGNLGIELEGTYGILTLNADGSYTYISNANIELPKDAKDIFTYTIQDGDGDLSTTTLIINVSDSGLAISESPTLVVYEKALDLEKDGDDLAAGTVVGSDPDDTRETATGQLAATGGIGGLTYSLVGTGQGIYGQIQLNADGSYTYTLTAPVTSTTGNDGANTELGKETFTYTVTDTNGNTQQGTISIDIVDDVPEAKDDSFSVVEGGLPCYNLMLIIDTSESMLHENRLVLAKEALINLINSYEGKASELRISVIDFGSEVKGIRADMTAAEAIEHINNLTADGYTNYEDPLSQAQTILTGQLENDKEGEVHRVYFISDGGPNKGVAPAGWQGFVDDKGIDVTAVAVGIEGDWAIKELDKVGNSGDKTLEIESADELNATLQGTVPTSTVLEGNVLNNDEGGADGVGRVISVTYDGKSYEVPEGGSVDITTSDGALTMYSNGNFTYTGPADVPEAGLTESFGYTMTDGDGDTSSATLNITVQDSGQTQPDIVDNEGSDGNGGNNGGGEGSTCPPSGYWIDHISLPQVAASFAGIWGAALAAADLLIDMGDINTGINLSWQNCPDGIELTREDRFDGENYVGERLTAFIDSQLEQAGNLLFFTLDMNIDGSYEFDLHNLDPMESGASLVGEMLTFEFTATGDNGEQVTQPFSIEIGSGVQHLSGSALADTIQTEVGDNLHILGLDGDDKLTGGDDIDVLIDGLGNDELNGDLSNNVLIGDDGIDTFIVTGIDFDSVNIIKDFSVEDRLDLSALLTDAGLDDLSDYLSFSMDNGDTLLQVAADNGNSQQIWFENVDLLAMYGSANSVELVNSMLEDQVLVINS